AHRYRRICSNDDDIDSNTNTLLQKVTKSAIQKAQNLNREENLARQGIDGPKAPETNLVLTFSANIPNINGILRRHYNILDHSHRTTQVVPKVPRAVYWKERNLGDVIT
ncbi:hypothetical protein HPB47_000158, partial [Ixodes persulcatus]